MFINKYTIIVYFIFKLMIHIIYNKYYIFIYLVKFKSFDS